MSKNSNKDLRQKIGGSSKFSESEKVRMALGKQLKLDVSQYQKMEQYENKVLFWCEKNNGDLENWLYLGAEPVEKVSKASLSGKDFPGLLDSAKGGYEKRIVDTDEAGNPVENYLMCVDPEIYEEYRIRPQREINQSIRRAMGMGEPTDEQKEKGIQTYAPDVGNGFNGIKTFTTQPQ